eukprot:2690259-Rhodomonas_salina.1
MMLPASQHTAAIAGHRLLPAVSPSPEQVADSLQKGTPGLTFVKHRPAMMGHDVLGTGPTLSHV